MAEIGRRRFLQFLGIGGATAAALTTPIPVFGSDDGPKLWTPDQKIVGGHLVLVPPRDWGAQRWRHPSGGKIELTTDDPESGEAIVGKMGRAWPTVRDKIWDADGKTNIAAGPQALRFDLALQPSWRERSHAPHAEHAIEIPLSEKHSTEDAHAAFYKGAHELRERFKKESLKILEQVPTPLRQDAQIVTLVNNAIYADAFYTKTDGIHVGVPHSRPIPLLDQRPGFILRAEWAQYVVTGPVEKNGWHVYSETGEYPIEIPSNLDMEFLLRMDKALLATTVTYNVSQGDTWTVVTTPGGKWTIPGIEPQTLGEPIKRPKIIKP